MKRILLAFFVVIMFIPAHCQNDLPNSIINLEAGVGVSFGGLGVKTVLGIKNSGLLIGAGIFPGVGKADVAIGAQLSTGPIYFDIGYGTVAYTQINDGDYHKTKAGFALVGGMIPLHKKKIVFIDLGMGLTFGSRDRIGFLEVNPNGVTLCAGLGFRIGSSK